MKISELFHSFDKFPAECAARLIEILKAGSVKQNLFELIQCVASLVGWLANVLEGEEKPIIGDEADCPECDFVMELCEVTETPVPAAGFGSAFLKTLMIEALLKVLDTILESLENDSHDSELMQAAFELLRVVLFHLGDFLEKLQDA